MKRLVPVMFVGFVLGVTLLVKVDPDKLPAWRSASSRLPSASTAS